MRKIHQLCLWLCIYQQKFLMQLYQHSLNRQLMLVCSSFPTVLQQFTPSPVSQSALPAQTQPQLGSTQKWRWVCDVLGLLHSMVHWSTSGKDKVRYFLWAGCPVTLEQGRKRVSKAPSESRTSATLAWQEEKALAKSSLDPWSNTLGHPLCANRWNCSSHELGYPMPSLDTV